MYCSVRPGIIFFLKKRFFFPIANKTDNDVLKTKEVFPSFLTSKHMIFISCFSLLGSNRLENDRLYPHHYHPFSPPSAFPPSQQTHTSTCKANPINDYPPTVRPYEQHIHQHTSCCRKMSGNQAQKDAFSP